MWWQLYCKYCYYRPWSLIKKKLSLSCYNTKQKKKEIYVRKNQARTTVTIDEITYYRDSLKPEDEQILQNILVVQEELSQAQRRVDITIIAKEALLTRLASRVSEFEVVDVVELDEVVE